MDKPTWLFANNFMFYFCILPNFKPVIIGSRSCKAHTTKSDWVINMVHVGPTLKIIVRKWFRTSKDVYWRAIAFFQIRRSWKSWGHRFFFFFLWKILGSQLEINKKLLGGYNILLQFWGGVIQFFFIKHGGHKILPR